MFRKSICFVFVTVLTSTAFAEAPTLVGCVTQDHRAAKCTDEQIAKAVLFLNSHLQQPNANDPAKRRSDLRRAKYTAAGGASALAIGLLMARASNPFGMVFWGTGALMLLSGGVTATYYWFTGNPSNNSMAAYFISPQGYSTLVKYLRDNPEYVSGLARQEPQLAQFLVAMKQIAQQQDQGREI